MTETLLKVDVLLESILTTRRKHGSSGDIQFRSWLMQWMRDNKITHRATSVGNIVATVGKSKTLFSCHVDTVHSMNESNKLQALAYDPAMGHLCLSNRNDSSCLGADDGAGIYVMLKMILAKVPGAYVFHVGEECGCIGSRSMLGQEYEWLKTFDRAIAFDRPDTYEVIVTQSGQECASADFGQRLADALNLTEGLDYKVSHKGVITDTKVYAGVIPECINLGVGYFAQHSPDEYLDVEHLERLVTAACRIDWEQLMPARVIPPPPKFEFKPFTPKQVSKPKAFPQHSFYDEVDDDGFKSPYSKPEDVLSMTYEDILTLCEDDPDAAAETIKFLLLELDAEKARCAALQRLSKWQ